MLTRIPQHQVGCTTFLLFDGGSINAAKITRIENRGSCETRDIVRIHLDDGDEIVDSYTPVADKADAAQPKLSPRRQADIERWSQQLKDTLRNEPDVFAEVERIVKGARNAP